MLRVIFPGQLLTKFESSVLQVLQNEKEFLTRATDLYKKGTEELIKTIDANITLISKEANASSQALVLEANADAIRIHQEALGAGINRMMVRLNITNPETRQKIFNLYTIEDKKEGGRVLLGDDNNLISVG